MIPPEQLRLQPTSNGSDPLEQVIVEDAIDGGGDSGGGGDGGDGGGDAGGSKVQHGGSA